MAGQVYFRSATHAAAYNKYRSLMPNDVLNKILSYLREKMDPDGCHLVDVGCGTGLSTKPFAPYLGHVTGIDASEAYIEEAKKSNTEPNVSFRVGSAESIPLDPNSVEVVSCLAAAHWFHLEKFFHEVDRILKPSGVLAVSTAEHGYFIPDDNEQFSYIFQQLKKETAGHWDDRCQIATDLYKDIELPFENKIRDTSIYIEEPMMLSHFMGLIRTLSGVAKCFEEQPKLAVNALANFETSLLKMFGPSTTLDDTIRVGKHYVVLLSQKPNQAAEG